MQTLQLENQTILTTNSRKEALKAVGGDVSRVFDANIVNLERVGFALFDLAVTRPEFAEKENRIAIKRGDKICRVYWHADGFWQVEAMKIGYANRIRWEQHPAVSLACRMYARNFLTKTSLEIGIRRSNGATPKHVFMALLGTGKEFVIVGKKDAVISGIESGLQKMLHSDEEHRQNS